MNQPCQPCRTAVREPAASQLGKFLLRGNTDEARFTRGRKKFGERFLRDLLRHQVPAEFLLKETAPHRMPRQGILDHRLGKSLVTKEPLLTQFRHDQVDIGG